MKILKEYKNTKNKIGHIAQLYHRILLLQLTIKLGWHYQAEYYTLRILDPVKILWMNNDQVLTPHRVCDKPEVFLKDCNVLCGLTWGVSKGLHCLVWFNCSLFSEQKIDSTMCLMLYNRALGTDSHLKYYGSDLRRMHSLNCIVCKIHANISALIKSQWWKTENKVF